MFFQTYQTKLGRGKGDIRKNFFRRAQD